MAFTACVARVGADIEPPGYVINDGSVFESVVRLCFTQLGKSLYSLLGPIKNEDKRKDSKASISEKHTKKHFRRWKKHSALVKNYLHGMSLVKTFFSFEQSVYSVPLVSLICCIFRQ